MIRMLGGAMIVFGCLGLGLWYKQQFIYRLKAVRSLQEILELLMSEIRYGKATLPECCRQLAQHTTSPYRECFGEVYQEMQKNTGQSFEEVFKGCMEDCLRKLPVRGEDRENFLRFTKESSFADEKMQLKSLEISSELLKRTALELEKENGEKCRMAVGLGAMSGLLLLIVLW